MLHEMFVYQSLGVSTQVFSQTTMADLRKKSLLLTGYLEVLLKQKFSTEQSSGPEAKKPRTDDKS